MAELEELQDRVKIKDNEIENPKAEIDNLKMLATKENSKRKTRKNNLICSVHNNALHDFVYN